MLIDEIASGINEKSFLTNFTREVEMDIFHFILIVLIMILIDEREGFKLTGKKPLMRDSIERMLKK